MVMFLSYQGSLRALQAASLKQIKSRGIPSGSASYLGRRQLCKRQHIQCYTSSSKKKTQAPPCHEHHHNHKQRQQQQQQQQQNSNSEVFFFSVLAWRLAIAYGGIYWLSEYAFQLTNCDGPSMLPTFQSSGDIILVDRWTPRLYGLQGGSKAQDRIHAAQQQQLDYPTKDEWHQPFIPANELPCTGKWKRFWAALTSGISIGDVIVVEHPRREGTVCKRVLGLPGDEILLKQSQYGVSHYVGRRRGKLPKHLRKSLLKVPDGHLWVEGDNSSNSLDSRVYGTIPASMIVGRVPFRIWPLRGDAMVERGMRPKPKLGEPRWGAQGSTVLPAGYEGQRIVKSYNNNKKNEE